MVRIFRTLALICNHLLSSSPPHLLDQFRATKIITVGDLAQLNATQLDVYPIPPPKLVTIQRVLSRYHEYLNDASTTRELLTPISIGYEKLIGTYSRSRGTTLTPPVSPTRTKRDEHDSSWCSIVRRRHVNQ